MDDASTKRAPRPRLLYPSIVAGRRAEVEPPFTILALGDYTLHQDDRVVRLRRPIRIDRESFEGVMAGMRLQLDLHVTYRLSNEPGAELAAMLRFKRLSDFAPDGIVAQVPEMRRLLELRGALDALRGPLSNNPTFSKRIEAALADGDARERLANELGFSLGPPSSGDARPLSKTTEERPSLVEGLLEEAGYRPLWDGHDVARKGVQNFVAELLDPRRSGERVDVTQCDAMIAEIDGRLSRQVAELLHHPDFQRLESAWRALKHLVDHADVRENVRVEVLSCSRRDLYEDFEDTPGVRKSGLYNLVCSDQRGGIPEALYGLIVADYEFGPGATDVALLEKVAAVASSAHAPFVAAASHEMFCLDDWGKFPHLKHLPSLFEGPQYARWQAFREREEARHVALCLPRFMVREPYGEGSLGARSFTFVEEVVSAGRSEYWDWRFGAQLPPIREHYLWGNAAFLFAAQVAASFARCGLPSEVVGLEGGGFVGVLPRYRYEVDGMRRTRSPLEVEVSMRREHELAEEGMIGLVHQEASGGVAFLSAQSCRKPRRFAAEERPRELRYAAACRLSDTLLTARIAQYAQLMSYERIKDGAGQALFARDLTAWLTALSTAGAGAEAPSGSAPFRAATIVRASNDGLTALEGDYPGPRWRCEVELTPYDTYEGAPYSLVVEC